MPEVIQELEKIAKYTEKDVGSTEENVKQKIMVPLLRSLGHKTEDLEFEHPTRRGRIDIFIKKNVPQDCKVIIDTKNYSEDLNKQDIVSQLKEYALDESSLLAILVNGSEMKIYSLFKGTAFEQSLLYCIKREDIAKKENLDILNSLLSFSSLKNRKVLDIVNEREREIKEVIENEKDLRRDYASKIEGIKSDIQMKEEEIENFKQRIINLEKEINKKIEDIWKTISLPQPRYNGPPYTPGPGPGPKGEVIKEHGPAKKVYLLDLVSANLIKDKQIVHLFYRNPIKTEKAQIVASENKLKYLEDGKLYTLSELARILLKNHNCISHGYSVQGPKYWQSESGKTIDDLNEVIRKQRGERG